MTDLSTKHVPAPAHEAEDPDGSIGGGIRRLFGRNWKTNLAALGTFVVGIVVPFVQSGLPQTPEEWARAAATMVITAGFGASKDFDKSHTQRKGGR